MRTLSLKLAAGVCAALALSACGGDDDPAPRSDGGGGAALSGKMYALSASNKLVSFDASAPGTVTSTAISGLASGDEPVGLDYRSHDHGLYLLANNAGAAALYSVTPAGAATKVANITKPDGSAFVLDGTHFALDFNSATDRMRVFGVGGTTLQNVNVNPITGTAASGDAVTDGSGAPPRIAAIAFTNSVSKASSTVLQTALYGIDADSNRLVRIGAEPSTNGTCPDAGNPACGVASDAGPVFNVDVDDNVSFDIDGGTGVGIAAMHASGAGSSTLYAVDLDSGQIAAVGAIGGGETVKGLTLAKEYEVNVYGVTETNKLFRFRPGNPHDPNTPAAIGLPVGVNVLGIDFRAEDGGLYALGSDGFLYTVDVDTEAATKVGTSTEPPVLTGSAFGVDFNSNADRLRMVSDTEENIRFNPVTGNDNPPDANVSPPGDIAAIAIDRNFVGASGVTKYGIDTTSNKLVTVGEGSANSGVVTELEGGGALGVNPSSTCAGFDIALGRDGLALAALDIGGSSVLHTINLATGVATAVGSGTIAVGEKVCSLSIEVKEAEPPATP